MGNIDYVGLSERLANDTLTEEDKKTLLKILKEQAKLDELAKKAVEANKEAVYGSR